MLVTIYWRTRVKVKQLTLSFPQMNTSLFLWRNCFTRNIISKLSLWLTVFCTPLSKEHLQFMIWSQLFCYPLQQGFFFIFTILLILTLTGKSISWQWGAFGWLVQGTWKRYHELLKMNASVPENIFLLYSSGDIWKFLK